MNGRQFNTGSPRFASDLPPIPRRPPGRPKKSTDGDQLTLHDAAKLLGWGPDRLARQIRDGTGPGRYNGVGYDIRRSWVESYLAGDVGFWDRHYREAVADAFARR